MAIAFLIFILFVGPAAVIWGVDSRVDDVDRRRRNA
jgi:hypothetical protein